MNNTRALRLEPTTNSIDHIAMVNLVGGSPDNFVAPGVYGATVAGGGAQVYFGLTAASNAVAANFGTVGGGVANTSSAESATVSGGTGNTSSGASATVSGGADNTSSGARATVSGGFISTSSGDSATVGGGYGNTSSGTEATVSGGFFNTSSGVGAAIPGGDHNLAAGANSLAAGHRAKAGSAGMFVWADSLNADFDPHVYGFWDNSFDVRATGGSMWVTSTNGTTGPYFIPGDLGWRSSCDRNLKENFKAVEPQEILQKLCALPIMEWNAKSQSPDLRHLGPTAQDFHAAFGLGGPDDKGISTIDEEGVALAAIQGLNQKLETRAALLEVKLKLRDARIQELERKLAEFEKVLREISKRRDGNGAQQIVNRNGL